MTGAPAPGSAEDPPGAHDLAPAAAGAASGAEPEAGPEQEPGAEPEAGPGQETGGGAPADRPAASGPSFVVWGRTLAPPETVWPLVGEIASWKRWAGVGDARLVRQGAPEPDGAGAVRRIRIGPGASREEVLVWEPPRRLIYRTVSRGLPVRSYQGQVELRRDGTGTAVCWQGTVVPVIPGTGAVVGWFLRLFVARFTRRLCRYADALPPGGA